jgi:hypothetical protein
LNARQEDNEPIGTLSLTSSSVRFHSHALVWAKVEVTGSVPPGVYGHSAALVDDNLMVVYGGYDNEIGKVPMFLCYTVLY